jgi:hypothetical protein
MALQIMKIRKNTGKLNSPWPFGPMLIMEGGRENLIPANPFDSIHCTARIVGAKFLGEGQHPKMPAFPVWFFELTIGNAFQIKIQVNCPREHLGYTLSTFATTSANIPIDLRLTFSDGDERKCDNIHVIKELTRFETAHEFASAPTSLSVDLRGEIVGERSSEEPITIGLAFLSIEEGLFASSPISPGGIRGGEQLSYTREADFFPVSGVMYAIALRWTTNSVELVINGRTVAESINIQMPDKSKLGQQVYIGSTSRSPNHSAFGTLTRVLAWNFWISDNNLRAMIFEKYPNVFPQFETDWIELQNPQPKLLTSQSWAFKLVQIMLRFQLTWQDSPPVWLKKEIIDESDYRDEIHRLLRGYGYISIPEAYSEAGRTDLLVSDKNDTQKKLRMEFKIWGRHDYARIPEKPLKYFVEPENIAIVMMINPLKNKRINIDYRKNVHSSTDFIGIINKPFEPLFYIDHFISLHERNDYYAEILHIILNRYGPFAIK